MIFYTNETKVEFLTAPLKNYNPRPYLKSDYNSYKDSVSSRNSESCLGRRIHPLLLKPKYKCLVNLYFALQLFVYDKKNASSLEFEDGEYPDLDDATELTQEHIIKLNALADKYKIDSNVMRLHILNLRYVLSEELESKFEKIFGNSVVRTFSISDLDQPVSYDQSEDYAQYNPNIFPQRTYTSNNITERKLTQNSGFLLSVYNSPVFRNGWFQLFLLAVVIAAALVAITLVVNPAILPDVINNLVVGLSELANHLIFGVVATTGIVSAVTLATSLRARFFAQPDSGDGNDYFSHYTATELR